MKYNLLVSILEPQLEPRSTITRQTSNEGPQIIKATTFYTSCVISCQLRILEYATTSLPETQNLDD